VPRGAFLFGPAEKKSNNPSPTATASSRLEAFEVTTARGPRHVYGAVDLLARLLASRVRPLWSPGVALGRDVLGGPLEVLKTTSENRSGIKCTITHSNPVTKKCKLG